MKVTNKNVDQAQTAQAGQAKAAKKTSSSSSLFSATPSRTEGNDSAKVHLSERMQDMKKIKDVANKSSPDVDEAKVAKYKSMIAKGEYKVDAKAVADKMVDEFAYSAGMGEEK